MFVCVCFCAVRTNTYYAPWECVSKQWHPYTWSSINNICSTMDSETVFISGIFIAMVAKVKTLSRFFRISELLLNAHMAAPRYNYRNVKMRGWIIAYSCTHKRNRNTAITFKRITAINSVKRITYDEFKRYKRFGFNG